MLKDRAIEIIAAYGADTRRWPPDERAGVAALAGRDPSVRAALVDARAIDNALSLFLEDAGAPPPRLDDASAAERALVACAAAEARERWRWRWPWGGAVAAAAVAAIALATAGEGPGPGGAPQPPELTATVAAGDPAATDAELLDLLFTSTIDEEIL
jgi:hypothetical protein